MVTFRGNRTVFLLSLNSYSKNKFYFIMKSVIISMSKKQYTKCERQGDYLKKQKRIPPILIAVVIGIIMVIIFVIGTIIEKYTPSDKMVSGDKINDMYYISGEDKDKIAIVLQDEIVEDKAVMEDNTMYLNIDFVKKYFDDRYYWDNTENVLLYTTPNDVIRSDVGTQDYYVTKAKNTVDYVIVKTDGTNVYVALDFVMLFSNIQYKYYDKPARLVFTYKWNQVEQVNVKENTELRIYAGIKQDILKKIKKKDVLTVIDEGKNWYKTVTEDGYIGYVKKKYVSGKKWVQLVNEGYKEPVYTNIHKDFTISMGWHMIVSAADNNNIVDLTTNTKGMNVISPTWFRIIDNNGTLSSLADESYVTRAHQLGLEVWARVDDQSSDSSNDLVFTSTSKRENIINQLISAAIQYNLDGINIDFEYITEDIAEDYIQCLRELSVKCRNNGIVLSVDDKVPLASNEYYNRIEQGKIVDYVIVMAYDEHWGIDSGAGSTASISWVTEGVANTVKQVPSEKVVLGIPFYTKIWGERSDGTVETFSNATMDIAQATVAAHGCEQIWLEDIGQNYSEYQEGELTYRIWIEDAASIERKVKLIGEYGLAGVSAWRLGAESADVWNTIVKYTN